jgi:hypothetical protein
MILPHEDITWLASAIDGEGTIVVNRRTGYVQICVYNSDYKYAKKAASLMGCKVYRLKSGVYSAYTNKRMTCVKVLKQIEPFLIVKRIKAISGIRSILDYYDLADIVLRAFPSLP